MLNVSRILLIDPSEKTRLQNRALLQSAYPAGEIVAAEANPGKSDRAFDLVVTESYWTGTQGTEVVARLLADDPARPVVVLTAHGDERLAVAMLRTGAADYLPQRDAEAYLVEVVEAAWAQALRRREQSARDREQARLYQETEQRARELAIIQQAASATAAVMNLDELLEQTTQVIVSALYPDVFGFLLWDETSNTFRAHPSYHGLPPEGYEIAVPLESITGRVIRTGRPVIVDDVRQTDDYFQIAAQSRSEIAVPVHTQEGRVIAVINAESAEAAAFSESDLRFLTTLAGQVASAIERARRYTDLRKDAAQLAAEVAERTSELREERDRMLAILESAGEGVLFADCDGKIQYVNPAMEHQTGYSREECMGHDARLWYREESGRKAYASMRRAVLSGERWAGEVVCWRNDLSSFDAAVTVSPLYSEEELLTGFVTIQADISHLKEVERLKSKFVANVSHELRTPLTTIKTYTSLLQRGGGERQPRYLEVIRWETERLERLIQDLLDLSRLDASESLLTLRPVFLPALVAKLVTIFDLRAKRKRISLRVAIPPDLPPVQADGERLQQVLHNLLANALAYTPTEGAVCVEAGWEERLGEEPPVWLRIRDSGPGVAADEMELVFDRFFRGRAAELSSEPGTGLGLAICREIVNMHGGKLEVEPVEGDGASFRVWLAAAAAEEKVLYAAE